MAIERPKLRLHRGSTYVFNVSDSSLSTHPLRFTNDSGTSEYTSGVTVNGTQGSSNANITFNVPLDAPSNLMYYCGTHGIGMGNKVKIIDDPDLPDTTNIWYGDRGFSIGGYVSGSASSAIEYFDITNTSANAASFGNMTGNSADKTAVSNGTRVVTNGGHDSLDLEYFTPATTGNATASGESLLSNSNYTATGGFVGGCDGLYGIFVGGSPTTNQSHRRLQTIVVQTAGSANSFSGLCSRGRTQASSCNDATRLVVIGGADPGDGGSPQYPRQMDYFTFITQANAVDFGDTNTGRHYKGAGNSNNTYGTFSGGDWNASGNATEMIQRITIATPGNASDHGDLGFNQVSSYATPLERHGQCGNSTHGRSLGGVTSSNNAVSWMQQWSMSTSASAVSGFYLSNTVYRNTGSSGNAS